MSLLTLIQDAADIVGMPTPSAVLSSTDTTTRQLLALANREGESLSRRANWEAIVREATFTTVATESQGTKESIAADFRYFLDQTQHNRTQQIRVGGPLTGAQWQTLKASVVTGPYHDFRCRGGEFLLIPAPPAGETVAFEYVSKHWCESASGTGQSRWAADDDVARLDEGLMLLGIVWRWKQQKGFQYVDDATTYEVEVLNAISRDGGAPILDMTGDTAEERPPVLAPAGSWNLP